MKSKLPRKFYSYFWDVNPRKINLEEKPVFVIKRVLEYGETESVDWLKQIYGLKKIKHALLKTRDLSRKTGLFWAGVLGLEQNDLPCLQIPYHRTPFKV